MDYQNNSLMYLGNTQQTYFEWIQSITWETWLVIVLVLAMLGFNVFYYLAAGTQDIHTFFAPILSYFGKTAAGATKQVISTAATGITGATNAVASTIDNSLSSSSLETTPQMQNSSNSFSNVLNTAGITTVLDNNTYTKNLQPPDEDVKPDQAASSIQSLSKEGWCYIGEERGYRSCAQVGVNDKCMSGDIFPTLDICVNPSLRQ
jgi:hypothetical protein